MELLLVVRPRVFEAVDALQLLVKPRQLGVAAERARAHALLQSLLRRHRAHQIRGVALADRERGGGAPIPHLGLAERPHQRLGRHRRRADRPALPRASTPKSAIGQVCAAPCGAAAPPGGALVWTLVPAVLAQVPARKLQHASCHRGRHGTERRVLERPVAPVSATADDSVAMTKPVPYLLTAAQYAVARRVIHELDAAAYVRRSQAEQEAVRQINAQLQVAGESADYTPRTFAVLLAAADAGSPPRDLRPPPRQRQTFCALRRDTAPRL